MALRFAATAILAESPAALPRACACTVARENRATHARRRSETSSSASAPASIARNAKPDASDYDDASIEVCDVAFLRDDCVVSLRVFVVRAADSAANRLEQNR